MWSAATDRKDADILASHRLMADIRNYMVSSTGYDEKNEAGGVGAGCCEPGRRSLQDATGCFDGGCVPGDVLQQGAQQTG